MISTHTSTGPPKLAGAKDPMDMYESRLTSATGGRAVPTRAGYSHMAMVIEYGHAYTASQVRVYLVNTFPFQMPVEHQKVVS